MYNCTQSIVKIIDKTLYFSLGATKFGEQYGFVPGSMVGTVIDYNAITKIVYTPWLYFCDSFPVVQCELSDHRRELSSPLIVRG